jgi:hypothetical protein
VVVTAHQQVRPNAGNKGWSASLKCCGAPHHPIAPSITWGSCGRSSLVIDGRPLVHLITLHHNEGGREDSLVDVKEEFPVGGAPIGLHRHQLEADKPHHEGKPGSFSCLTTNCNIIISTIIIIIIIIIITIIIITIIIITTTIIIVIMIIISIIIISIITTGHHASITSTTTHLL